MRLGGTNPCYFAKIFLILFAKLPRHIITTDAFVV